MSEKVKVSKEVAEIIADKINKFGKQMLIINHASCFTDMGELIEENAWIKESKPLNNVSVEDLAKALYIGYQVEQTPEEKLIEYFNLLRRTPEEIKKAEIEGDMIPGLSSEQVVVINTLNFLSHKVKGVNC
ncbi:hypothetical protein ABE042_04925 [Viridibacillus arvi]|uniref:hypothetical protein n=1 Tax=Viridibacillus arvi TaxID=263475 RepID=UPI003D27710C